MSNIFVVSDTHFNHENILKFLDKDGKTFRNFSGTEEMNELMIERWNKVVKEKDKVYHLGDVYFGPNKEAENILRRLNGKKRLVVGNHDSLKDPVLHRYFQKIMLWRFFKENKLILTHVPIHQGHIGKADYNVHGHIHEKKSPSELYKCVCVEHINYTPIHIDDIVKLKTHV